MNYTENYHLPQWEPEDRILRADFNRMCADIDAGLRAGALATEAQVAAAVQAAATDSGKLLESAFRAAYNHFFHVRQAEPVPRQLGFFSQTAGGAALPGNVSSMLQLGENCWLGRSAAAFAGADLLATLTTVSNLRVEKDNLAAATPLVATITPPGPCYLTYLRFMGSFSNNAGSSGLCQLTMTDLTAGETALVLDVDWGLAAYSSGTRSVEMNPNVTLHGNHQYQVTLTPLEAGCDMYCAYDSSAAAIVSCLTAAEAVTVWALDTGESSQGGLVLARYALYGAAETPVLTWDGVTLAPHKTRTVTDEQGRTVTEAEFRRTDAIPAQSSLTLRMPCGVDGEVWFYGWGAMLI